MSLPSYLNSIKSSGIYRFVFDKSEVPAGAAEVLRLVVGYSEKGPFNTPTYIKDAAEFTSVYGPISKKLERRGIYFHRLALQALGYGPIICLNLKKFSNETVEYVSFSPQEVIAKGNNPTAVENVFDTTKFWTLDAAGLQERILGQTSAGDLSNYITLAATDSKEASNTIVMRGYTPKGYGVTFKSYFTSLGEEMPDYLLDFESEIVEDYFAKIYVFKGQITPQLAVSEAYAKYFDVASDGTVSFKPYLTNAFGEKVDTLDTYADDENSNLINVYSGCLLPFFKNLNGSYISLDLVFNTDNSIHKQLMNLNPDGLYEGKIKVTDLSTSGYTKLTTSAMKSILASDGGWTELAMMSDTAPAPYVSVATWEENTESPIDSKWSYVEKNASEYPVDLYVYEYSDGVTFNTGTDSEPSSIKFTHKIVETSETINGESVTHYVDLGKWSAFTVGTKLLLLDGDTPVVATITKSDTVPTATGDEVSTAETTITLDKTVSEYVLDSDKKIFIICNHIISEAGHKFVPTYLSGYDFAGGRPNGSTVKDKVDWQNDILSALTVYRGMRTALTNRTDLEYRYIVDTFEAFPCKDLHSQLAIIAKEKDNAFAFLNFPSVKSFRDCGKQYKDENGKFQVKYLPMGGNPQGNGNPTTSISLVDEGSGASYASYNTPVTFTDGTVKTYVPSAALVSNNFMQKYTTRQPYYIVAGPTYGRISASGLVGPDYNYSRADLDILEPWGVNAMVYVPRKGTYINSNQTAKQSPVTALSKINVRELCIYLQDEIEALLQDYQWEFNTAALRNTVKSRADVICDLVKANGGIYNFLNVCDETNNTDDVINNEMFVLSTSIEPGMGCGKMVQTLTLYKKGGMTAVVS